MTPVEVKLVESEAEMEAALAVRIRVFVAEQSVPAEEELDEEDATATHAIARHNQMVIGTGRLLIGEEGTCQIGRMAVDQPWRRQGVEPASNSSTAPCNLGIEIYWRKGLSSKSRKLCHRDLNLY